MKMYAAIILVLIFCFELDAQHLKFNHYNDKNGLSHNSVRHIIQDQQGFLWLGTFSGLNRFDGYQFKPDLLSSSVDSDIYKADVTGLELDTSTNNLWIATNKGLYLFNTATHELVDFLHNKDRKDNFPYEEIRSVHIDRHKRVWVGTKYDGLYLYGATEKVFTKVDLPNYNYIKEIFEDNEGNIWIGSYNGVSIAKITLNAQGTISQYTNYILSVPHSDEKHPYIHFIYQDHKQDIFAGTREGLYKLNKESNAFENLYIEDDVIREDLGPYFLSIARAPDGKFWLGTLGGLIVCNNLEDIAKGDFERHFSILSDDTSLIDNLISALYFDGSGVLWIGTENGLDKYDPYENQFKINKDISLYIDNKAPTIKGFSKTYDNHLIVATKNNGLFISKGENFVPLHYKTNNITSIYSDDGKTFYCGLWDGKILVYDYVTKTSRIKDIGFLSSPVMAFLKYDPNTLIVGSFGEGALFLDAKTLATNGSRAILPDAEIDKIKRQGNALWLSTKDGVIHYDVDTRVIKRYRNDIESNEGLPHNYITDILVDDENNVWVSTRNGIAKYNAGKDNFDRISQPEELLGKWITDIEIDSSKSLWLNMNNNSLARYEPKSNEVHFYQIESGNRLDVFSRNGFFKFNDTQIYVGAQNGIIYFSPNNIEENSFVPPPVITNFKIQNKEVLPGVEINGQVPLEKDINYSKDVILDYKNRNISFQFSSPSYTNERLNRFQYRLSGFDEHWVETTSDSRTVQYTNLPSQTYTFEVRSRNSDGNWSKTSTYKIRVLPIFWLTGQGLGLILLALVLITFFARKQIRSRLKLKRELLMEKVQRERDEKLNNEKLRFFTNISHELRTPLTLILGPVKQLLEQEDLSPYSKGRGNLIQQNAERLLRLVNQILDFRRAETGELALKVFKIDILVRTENILNSFVEVAHAKNITLNLNVEEESMKCWIDIDKYNKILFNLLSNALKFTNEYGNVDLFIGFKENELHKKLVIEVSDDGIGIPLESQEHIFSRFYQVQNGMGNTTGTGIGLSLVKSLVEIHKGEIKVESVPGKGSIFTVILPVYKSAFTKKELGDFPLNKDIIDDTLIPIKKLEASFKSVPTNRNNVDVKQKILIIEDNAELRKYVVEFLSDFYKVYEAENGKEGLKICRKIKPTLCVADVMMPKMDGFEFVMELKKDENLSHIPVVLLTALAENENRINGYKIGVDGYLVKPFDPSLLKTRIDNILKNHFDLKQKFSGDVESDVLTLAHSQLDIELITKVKNLIEENIDYPELSSSFICKELGLSSSKLYRKITELTDLPPNEFIKTIRLKKSAHLLRSRKYNVSEVADMVGFKDPFYFSKCFKKQFGRSPSALIK
ncbi:hybrid sensor histidine kinase/response regulator transcription factor [Allomuricauda sp. M10]|uniref:hybrid sensor histidine kinase/response regulator transcription factor n=1 Tax=Allomuricauda sp. M10 TaxID=2683292 RepID=UPI001D17E97F|nr:hybrid sensor histidine kinase/response regulator transcription factor [Muricauda sp. M10]